MQEVTAKRVRSFINENARPLDVEFLAVLDGNLPSEALKELARFQNADGGFGHGIEPDLQLSESSPFATSVGLRYLAELQGDTSSAAQEQVANALAYLFRTVEREVCRSGHI